MCAFAQQGANTQSANRVTLYVVAKDKSGNPVTGLEQQNFTVLDNKQPQNITSFSAVGHTTTTDNDVEIILLLDAVNTDFSKVAFARQQEDNFLRREGGRLAWPVSVAIFSDKGLDMQPSPSQDGNAVAKLLDQKETGLRTSNRSQGFYGAADRSEMSIRALQELAAFEAKKPGRKLVIWISPGWALLTGPRITLTSKQQDAIFNTIVGVSTALRQAGVTLYQVNPLGTGESLSRTYYYEEFLNKVTKPSQTQFADLSLQVFAIHSGGLFLTANNDVTGEIQRCVRDANAYYTLSFDPPAPDGPNFYNAIEVKIDRPDVKAQTLSGFYARPEVKP